MIVLKIKTFILACVVQQAFQACSSFEWGKALLLSSSSPSCAYSQSITQGIQFTKEFCEPPQIIIFESAQIKNPQAVFKIQLVNISRTDFYLCLICSTTYTLNIIEYQWVAFIDDKIFVINDFLDSLTLIDGQRTKLIPYPIHNPELEISCYLLNYVGGNPNITVEKQVDGFNLYITGVTSAQVVGLSVQIVVGLKSSYQLLESHSNDCTGADFQYIEPKRNSFMIIGSQFPILTTTNRFEVTSTSQITYYPSYYISWRIIFPTTPSTWVPNLYLYIARFAQLPHYNKKIRVSQMMCLDYRIIQTFDTQMVYIKEIDLTLSDDSIAAILPIQYQSDTLSLVYSHQCQPKRKITVQLLKYQKKEEQIQTYTYYCHRVYNLITMYIYQYQSRFGLSELEFDLNQQGLSLQETIIDSGDTYQLLKIEFQ